MTSKNDRTPPQPADPPTPKKRFHIVKLEERVAPKKGGKGTHNCGGGGSANDSGSIVSNF